MAHILQQRQVLSNTCMIALPILSLLIPKSGATYGVLGVVVLIIGLQTMSFLYEWTTVGSSSLKPAKIFKSFLHSMSKNYFIAFLIGLILSFFSIRLPVPLYNSLNVVGATTAPIALFAIGAQLDFSVFLK